MTQTPYARIVYGGLHRDWTLCRQFLDSFLADVASRMPRPRSERRKTSDVRGSRVTKDERSGSHQITKLNRNLENKNKRNLGRGSWADLCISQAVRIKIRAYVKLLSCPCTQFSGLTVQIPEGTLSQVQASFRGKHVSVSVANSLMAESTDIIDSELDVSLPGQSHS